MAPGTTFDALQDRQCKGAGLAGAGLRLGKDVAPGAERRYRELLHRGEGGPAELFHSAVEVVGKRDQLFSFAGNKKASRNVTRLAVSDAFRQLFLEGPE